MPLISLSDAELDAVQSAAAPLPVKARREFLAALASELEKNQRQLGPGLVSRICRDLQRRYFDAPNLNSSGKYD